MKTSLLARFSPSFHGVPQSASIIMCTPWIDVALGRAVDRQDALAAQDVAAAQLQQRAHPFLELVGIDRPVGGEGQARDLVAVVVVVAVLEEVGLELEDALEVERALVEDGGELDLALLRPVDAGVGVDRR